MVKYPQYQASNPSLPTFFDHIDTFSVLEINAIVLKQCFHRHVSDSMVDDTRLQVREDC